MDKKKMVRRVLSTILVIAMVVVSLAGGKPKQAQAAVTAKELVSTYINVSEMYLYLGGQGAGTYDFNIKEVAKKQGATYSWYVKADKGNLDAVMINKETGVVTAKQAGTAYIRCKVTLAGGTVLRPEAKVTVRNNITEVEISNISDNLTLTAGIAKNFNRNILNTAAGKDVATQGITRWEISEDTAEAINATTKGIVFPMKEGEFKLRAVCFQSTAKYKLWLADKEANAAYITAASEWVTMKVTSANGAATVSTGEQLSKALVADNINQITLSTKEALTFTIPEGDYSNKTLIVDAANADVENHGIFKEITIKAIKDNTWIEFADGNIVYLNDDVASFTIEAGAQVRRIVIDRPNSTLNLVIRGTVEQITVTQPSRVNITGSGANVPVTVEETAGGSTITSSMALDLELKARTEVILKEGSEETNIDKSKSTVEVKVENNTKKDVTITTGNTGGETIGSGKTVVSDETTTPATTVAPAVTSTPIMVNAIAVTSAGNVTEIGNGETLQMSAVIAPVNATNQMITWSATTLDNGTATINSVGLLTGTGVGSITVTATNVATGVTTGTKVITITTPAKDFDFDSSTGTITSYYGSDEYVVIPSIINSVNVTIIGNSAFRYDYSTASLIIPDTVTIIKSYAFNACQSLKSVTLSRNLQRIEDWAFASCHLLTSVIIPASVTEIRGVAFLNCEKLNRAFFLGNAPTTFGEGVFGQDVGMYQGYENFKIYYQATKTGYGTPTWNGYTCESYDPDATYTLNYNGNGNTVGVVAIGSSGHKAADKIVVSDKGSISKDGYLFSGWSAIIDGSVSYQPNQVLAMDGKNMTLYAVWTKVYTITIDPTITNGTITVDKSTAKEGELITGTITPDPGWFYMSGVLGDMGSTYGFYMQKGNVIVQALFGRIIVAGTGGATTITTNNGTLQMLVSSVPADAVTGSAVTWSVASGTGTATISEEGFLTAATNGTVTVTAASGIASGASGSAVITISNQNAVISTATVLITPPEIGGTPAPTIADGTGYTGTISWITPTSGNFEKGISPSATVILTADSTHKFTGIAKTGAITIAGSTSATYAVSGTNGETLTITVGYPVVAENITALALYITAPAAGLKHDLYLTPIKVQYSYVYMYLDNPNEHVNTPYVMGNVYSFHCEFSSGPGYKFPMDGLTPTLTDWLTKSINIGTIGQVIVSGGNKSGNRLIFDIILPAVVAASTDATLMFTKGTVDNALGTIAVDPGTTLNTLKVFITPAAGATFEVYESDQQTLATDLVTGCVVIVTAQDATTTKIYTITVG